MVERPGWVEVFFDIMCPYAYQSSIWIRDVRDRTGLEVRWRFLSLEEINRVEGKKHPWERDWSYGWSQMRIGAWLRRGVGDRDGNDLVDQWYTAVGKAFHEHGRKTHVPDVHREVLAEVGLDPSVLDDAIADPTTTEDVRADHLRAVEVLGAFGVPTFVFPDGSAVFQKIVPAPPADRAVELFDLLLEFNEFPQLSELHHLKTASDVSRTAKVFEPYLRARSWNTIQNPRP